MAKSQRTGGGAGEVGSTGSTGTGTAAVADTVQPKSQLRVSGFSALLFLLVVLGLVIIAPDLHRLLQQHQQLLQVQEQLEKAKEELAGLEADRARWADPAYIRAQARERLYYILPGETSYLVINDVLGSDQDTPKAASAELTRTKVDWLEQLVSSTLIAGLSNQPVEELPLENQNPLHEVD